MENNVKLKIELTKELSKIVNIGLNKYDLQRMTALANSIWSCENIENNYKYYKKDLKAYFKQYKEFYIIKAL